MQALLESFTPQSFITDKYRVQLKGLLICLSLTYNQIDLLIHLSVDPVLTGKRELVYYIYLSFNFPVVNEHYLI